MPTNANTFNSRVTSEALEAKFRQVFPAQGGAELVQDLFASGVIQPVVDFSTVAEGSVLAPNLQTAWDFSTSIDEFNNSNGVIVNNPGFWKVKIIAQSQASLADDIRVTISDGLSNKPIWEMNAYTITGSSGVIQDDLIVFLRAGDSLNGNSSNANSFLQVFTRQIADVNGNLVNPLGFTFS